MRISKRGASLIAIALMFSVLGAACGDSTSDKEVVTIAAVRPENPLVPMATTELGGGRIIRSIFTGLTAADPKTAVIKNALADKIETTDSQNYTITIKKGWKFHDGTEIKAKNFVDAWNFAAYTPNGMQNGPFFENIAGFEKVHTIDPDQNGPQPAPTPETDKMSGLQVVDDHTFTVALNAPLSIFTSKLSYVAFYPMPDVFFTDRAGYEKRPVGNGPFKVTSTDTKRTELERFSDYKGNDKAKVKKVTWQYYTNDLTAYRDVQSGKLDFMDRVPVPQLNDYKETFKGQYFDGAVATVQQISIPVYRPEYSDPRVRKAISMSIDRDEIATEIFQGAREAATGYVSPTIDGYVKDQCGSACTYNPAAAKALLDEAGGFPGEKIEIWYNTDGAHKDWLEAVAAQIQEALGVPTVALGVENFADIRTRANAMQFEQLYRSGWQAAYPSLENFLNPLFRTGGSANDNGYSNPAVDTKLGEADRTTDVEAATKLYQEAEKLILDDMPVIPGLYIKQQSVWSDDVKNVVVDWKGDLVVSAIELK